MTSQLHLFAVRFKNNKLIKIIVSFFLGICSRKFIHQKTLESHLSEHDENGSLAVTCQICFKKISEKRHLKRHMRIHKEKSFICEQCNESFQEKYQLTRYFYNHLYFTFHR